ncbi:hypothetical protein [Streptomyces sp. NBC_00724]|uniref:hypothetical protein n=1 Tax=Streptomyces sp. NBC_00724 TaxID=2975812 RepID=UPI002ED64BD3|nr:hypothetical protein OHB17_01605 [Streptomyces sp. NBC_00724]
MTDFAHAVRPRITAETNKHLEPGTSRHIRAAQHVQDDRATEIVEAGHPNLLLREPMPYGHR